MSILVSIIPLSEFDPLFPVPLRAPPPFGQMGTGPSKSKARAGWESDVTVKNVLVRASVADLQDALSRLTFRFLPSRPIGIVSEMASHRADLWLYQRHVCQDGEQLVVALVLGMSSVGRPVIVALEQESLTPPSFATMMQSSQRLATRLLSHFGQLERFPDYPLDHTRSSERTAMQESVAAILSVLGEAEKLHSSWHNPLFFRGLPLEQIRRWMKGHRQPFEEPHNIRLSIDFLYMLRSALELLHLAYVPTKNATIGI